MQIKVLNELILRGLYEITGVTDDGEVVLAIISEDDKKIIESNIRNFRSDEQKLELIKKLISVKGRPAKELMQIYLQETAQKEDCCLGNGLRIK